VVTDSVTQPDGARASCNSDYKAQYQAPAITGSRRYRSRSAACSGREAHVRAGRATPDPRSLNTLLVQKGVLADWYVPYDA